MLVGVVRRPARGLRSWTKQISEGQAIFSGNLGRWVCCTATCPCAGCSVESEDGPRLERV